MVESQGHFLLHSGFARQSECLIEHDIGNNIFSNLDLKNLVPLESVLGRSTMMDALMDIKELSISSMAFSHLCLFHFNFGLSRGMVESYLGNITNKLSEESKEELTAYYRAFSVMDAV